MADEKNATGHEEQAPPAGPGGSKAPPAPQAEQQLVQLGIENLDAPASDTISLRITNNGRPPESTIVPKGGLLNLHRHVTNLGGIMDIQWSPDFVLTVTIPAEKEAAE